MERVNFGVIYLRETNIFSEVSFYVTAFIRSNVKINSSNDPVILMVAIDAQTFIRKIFIMDS